MLSVFCIIHGVLLAQAPLTSDQTSVPIQVAAPALPRVPEENPVGARQGASTHAMTPASVVPELTGAEPGDTQEKCPTDKTSEPASPFSIFSRPYLADRNGLSFVLGTGPGRFNMIDW